MRSGSIKSGYVSLPARVLLKKLDNKTGSYPPVLRTGDIDRKGKINVSFNDTNTVVFGKRIADHFSIASDKSLGTLDSNKWTGSTFIKLRKEILTGKDGKKSKQTAVVFEGAPDGSGRWIQTKDKIRNPIVVLRLIQGPHNIIRNGLNLERGASTETLKIQISTNGTTYTTIKTYTPTNNLSSFYDDLGKEKASIHDQYRKTVKLNFSDFNVPGNSFYLRILQSTVEDHNKAVWAISDIDITSMDQSVIYPLLIDHGTSAGTSVVRNSIATPHKTTSAYNFSLLNATGRSIPGISDGSDIRVLGENITAFNEEYAIEDPSKQFYLQGTDPKVLPGFSQKLADKTKIILNLSTSYQTTAGYDFKVSGATKSLSAKPITPEAKLMVYWNDSLRRWEKIGYGVNDNSYNFRRNKFGNYLGINHQVTASALGFGPLGSVSTGSSATTLDKSIISSYVRPTKTFGFPFGGRYHATSSQAISMKNYISHPFLLEKAVIEFQSKFEFADGVAPGRAQAVETAYALKNISASLGRNFTYDKHSKYYLPTFFMLNQRKDKLNQFVFYDTYKKGILTSSFYRVKIPGNFDLGNETLQRIDTTRELISYGQLGILLSGSTGHSLTSPGKQPPRGIIKSNEVLDNGLRREALLILTSSTTQYTGSFRIEFNSKVSRQYGQLADSTMLVGYHPTIITGTLSYDDRLGGRGSGNLDSSSRAFVNGFPGFLPGEAIPMKSFQTGYNPRTIVSQKIDNETEEFDLESPYILFPEDNLILGFQYPRSDNTMQGGATKFTATGNLFTNRMTLFGNARLILYGSLVRGAKEHHNTVNQILTSDAIHEIIGSEIPLDQFQIRQRHEFTGSYIDDLIYQTGPHIFGAAVTETPTSRIGKKIASITNFNSYFAAVNASGSLTRFVGLQDSRRMFEDSKIKPKVQKTAYGSFGTAGTGIYPSYYFNYEHFGLLIDMVRQGRDSVFSVGPSKSLTDDDNDSVKQITSSPVSVTFVTSDSSKLGSTLLKTYNQETITTLLKDSSFQSSNVDQHCTSSVPYKDNNTPSNRTY